MVAVLVQSMDRFEKSRFCSRLFVGSNNRTLNVSLERNTVGFFVDSTGVDLIKALSLWFAGAHLVIGGKDPDVGSTDKVATWELGFNQGFGTFW